MVASSVPGEPEFTATAERVVWQALMDTLPDGCVLVPGLRLSDRHEDREADVVVLWPGVGLAVVEVKGGRVTLEGRQWLQHHGPGRSKRVDPVGQARACKYMIRGHLARRGLRWPRMTHLVAFPGTTVPTDFAAPDCERWRVLDRHDLAGDVAARVRDALDLLVDHPEPPDDDEIAAVLDALTGAFIPQRDLVGPRAVADAVAEREQVCDVLTRQQARVLDGVGSNPRVEVVGGAGSGKTWLAVEQARRLAARGQRVGLLCYSRGLAEYLRRRADLLPAAQRPVYTGTFHGLGQEWLGAPGGSDDDSDFWEVRLPEEMARLADAQPEGERFDAFVVDEAQDFADSWWPALIAGLRDRDAGGLYVFADERQRVFARQGRPPVTLFRYSLDENLRNTKQIAQTFGSLAPAQMRYRGGDGVPVRFVDCPTDDALGRADDEACALLDAGWAPEHIALLTTGRRHPVQVERQHLGHDAYWSSFWDGDDLFYGHVLGFKGLERPAVVLALNGFRDLDRAREMLYVGLSRARDLLVVVGDAGQVRAVGGEGVARRLGVAR